jgi:hypothetical protein
MFGDSVSGAAPQAAAAEPHPINPEWAKERCWKIASKLPARVILSGKEIYWGPMTISYGVYRKMLQVVQEGWFSKKLPPSMGSSYSFRNGCGRFWFEKKAYAQAHFDALKTAGVVE